MSHPTTPARRRLPFLALLAAAVAIPLLGLATGAAAQGTSGVLPDPLTGRDLSTYAKRLELSDQQRLAVDTYHTTYLDEFRELREGEITEFIDEASNVMRTFMFAPDSRQARKYLDELERLMNKIKQLDERFFDELQTVLSDEQAPALLRVRQMRERARYSSGIVRFVGYANAGTRVDLSSVVDGLDLPPEERKEIDPLVETYEGELTRSLRKLFDETQAMFIDLLKKLEAVMKSMEQAAGGGPPRGMWSSMRDILAESSKGVMSQASSISKLNRRSHSSLASVLPEESARALKDAYHEAAYPEVHGPAATALAKFDAALELEGISEETREAIEIAQTDLRARHDRLADKMIDLLEVTRKESPMLRFGGSTGGPEQERYEKLRARRDEMNETAMDSLAALLGAGLQADLDDFLAEKRRAERSGKKVASAGGTGGAVGTDVAKVTPGGTGEDDGAAGGLAGPDRFLPGPISRRELKNFARLLAIDDDEKAVIESLHGGYLESYEALRETHIQPIEDAGTKLWALDPDTGRLKAPPIEAIDAQYELRRAALVAINELDESFLSDVEVLLSGSDVGARMERVRLARARVVYNRGAGGGGGGYSGMSSRVMRSLMGSATKEEQIDLVDLVDRQQPADEARKRVQPVLVGYERSLVDALKRRYDLAMEVEQAGDRAGAESAAIRESSNRDGERRRSVAFSSSFRQLTETIGRELQEMGRSIIALNRETLERLVELLAASEGGALRGAYRRAAHPEVYKDPGSAESFLRGALALEDVTTTQRGRISDILDEYVEPYSTLCEKMADLEAETADADRGGFRARDWQRFQQRRNELERLRFDRNELNDKTRRRLRSLLSEEQAQRLGLVITD